MFGIRRRRRARLRRVPLGDEQWRLLESRLAWTKGLAPERRRALEGMIQIFLAEKRFEGCGGLVVTDEMRLVIAAEACFLLLGLGEGEVYPGLHSILVYPHAYVATARTVEAGIVTEGPSVRLGETWSRGSLVIAWDHVESASGDLHGGHNVVLHEFAHQLDLQDGTADGTPPLPSRSRYLAWGRHLGEAYADLRDRVDRHRPSVLDGYGGTNPAEFFAVATECFFERPRPLERAYPDLYDELRRFYRRDPAALQRGEPERIPEEH